MKNKSIKKEFFHTKHVIEKRLRHHVIEWTATFCTIIGTLMNAQIINNSIFSSKTLAFYPWIAGNILWIIFSIKHKHWGVLATFGTLFVINTLALIKIYNII